jgi:5-(carboxyamino)imidazole ribonucleotide mutase
MQDLSPLVGIAMGSESDWPVLEAAAEVLRSFGVPFEARVLSAHRTPDAMADYARTARARGLRVIVAGAGGAAHLPGMIAAHTSLPVVGVPVPTKHFGGLDSLLSIVQMPGGVPVATVAVGQGKNAGLLAVQILAVHDERLAAALDAHRAELREQVAGMDARVQEGAAGPT